MNFLPPMGEGQDEGDSDDYFRGYGRKGGERGTGAIDFNRWILDNRIVSELIAVRRYPGF